MAISCTPSALVAGSDCIACNLTHKQLLASLVYVLCQVNKMNCTPASLASAAECYKCAMTEKQLLASAVYILCTNGAGGGGGGGQLVVYTAADPTTGGNFPTDKTQPAIAYSQNGTGPTYVWNTLTQAWN